MSRSSPRLLTGCLALLGALAAGPDARAAFIHGGPTTTNESGLGAFTGSLDVTPNGTNATLTLRLTNTSPAANGGFLTAFALNNPGGFTINLTSSTSGTFGTFLDSPDGVGGAPFGQFDFGVSTGSDFAGGGSPGGGLGVGQSATFVFSVTGAGAGSLTADSFLSALSTGTGAGRGYQAFLARFRGFENGGSDKVVGAEVETADEVTAAPAPASLLLAASAAPVLLLLRARSRRAAPAC